MRRPRGSITSVLLVGAIGLGVAALLLAPRPGASEPADEEQGPQIVTPTRRDLRSVVALQGTIAPSPDVPVPAPIPGRLDSQRHQIGDHVVEGDVLATITDPSGALPVAATATGIITEWAYPDGADVAGGARLGVIAPDSYQAVADIEPDLLYRFDGPPIAVTVGIENGPAPFPCPLVSFGAEDDVASGGSVRIRCEVPSDIRAFPGSRASIGAVTGEAPGAITLPLEAVIGQADLGTVTIVSMDGRQETRNVALGLSDGIYVEVVDGLDVDEAVVVPPPS